MRFRNLVAMGLFLNGLLWFALGCEMDRPDIHYLPEAGATYCDYILDWEARRVCKNTEAVPAPVDGGAVNFHDNPDAQ